MHEFMKWMTTNPAPAMPNLPDLDEIGSVIFSRGFGKGAAGTYPSPYASLFNEVQRRHVTAAIRQKIDQKIESLLEPRFITPPETSELIASIVSATDSRNILELGMYSGFTSLHVLKAIIGKEGAKLTSIDCRPAHDEQFFAEMPQFRFINGWTPQCLDQLAGENFDLVFIDSDHTAEHCEKERIGLLNITQPGSIWLFHDVPEWRAPTDRQWPPVRHWLNGLVIAGFFYGLSLPTCEQPDCVAAWGKGYPRQCNPGLGVYIRR